MSTTRDLTSGPIWRALATVSAPMTIGILGVLSVGLADAIFLGQIGGAPLAAVGFIFPVITAITSLSIGLSAGTNASISQAIGAKEGAEVESRLALHAVGLGVVLALTLGAVLWLVYPALFRLLGASEEVATEIAAYMPWWILSFPPLVIMMQSQAAFRAHGNGIVAAALMTGSALVNIALDPLLIFGLGPMPGLGTGGAGIATMAARMLGAVAALAIAWRAGILTLPARPLTGIGASARRIVRVGAPAALSNAINPAGMAAVTAAVAVVGTTAVAGFGAATRVQSLALVPLMALSAGIGPVVGQNWGAGREDRARSAMLLTFGLCGGYGFLAGTVLFLTADPLGRLIASDADAAAFCATYLRIVGWSLFGYGMLVTANAAMNARDRALWSMSLSLGRIGLAYLPFAWLGVSIFGYTGVVAAAAAANVLGAVAAVFAVRKTGLLTLPDRIRSPRQATGA